MAFVTPVYVPQPRASLEAQDLAREIEQVVVDFQKRRPRTSNRDVQQAMNIVESREGMGISRHRSQVTTIIAVAIGLLVMFGLSLFLFLAR
jgi:hypothetical protein